MDEAQQWYEGTMEKAALDQGALKRQIAQVLSCSGMLNTYECETAAARDDTLVAVHGCHPGAIV